MRHFGRPWGLALLALAGVAMIAAASALLSTTTPLGPGLTETGVVLQALGGKLVTLTLAVLFFAALDRVFLPFLKIEDVMFGRGPWATAGEDRVRAAVILGWFLVFAAVILGVAWGGA